MIIKQSLLQIGNPNFGYPSDKTSRFLIKIPLFSFIQAKVISQDNTQITYRSLDKPRDIHIKMLQGNIDTLEKMFKYCANVHSTKRCLGTRKIISEEDEMQPNGRLFKKYKMGDYMWRSFVEVDGLAASFGRGLRSLGIPAHTKIVLFAETRAEWMIAAHGCFKQSMTIVTIYATLGDEGVTHGIAETEVDTIVTSHELMPKLKNIVKTIPKIRTIIYFEDQLHKTDTEGFGNINIIPFSQVLKTGASSKIGE